MTRPDLDGLDRRGAAAASDLHARTAERPVPPFSADRALGAPVVALADRRPRGRLVAAAALVAAVVGGAVWVGAGGGGDDDQGPTQVRTTLPSAYLAGDLPDGLLLAGAGEVSIEDAAGTTSTGSPLVIYGPAPDEPKVGVARVTGWDLDALEGGTDRTVDGRTVTVVEGSGIAPVLVVTASPEGSADTAIALVSASESVDDLAELSVRVTADGGRPQLAAGDLPDGWRELGDEPDSLYFAVPVAAMRGSTTSPSRSVVYATADLGSSESTSSSSSGEGSSGEQGAPEPELPEEAAFPGTMVSITSLSGDEVRLHASELVLSSVEEIEVRGHAAVVGRIESGGPGSPATEVVAWLEAPGELIRMTGWGLGRNELLDIAGAVEPVDADEWDDLVERSALGDLPGAGAFGGSQGTEIARGTFEDGTSWILRGDPEDPAATTELDVALPGDSSSSSTGFASAVGGSGGEPAMPLPVVVTISVLEQGGRRFASGVVRSDAVRIEQRDAAGAGGWWTEVAPFGEASGETGTGWFVVELRPETTSIAVLDVGDVVLDELPIDGTNVDPDGVPTTMAGTTIVGD